MGSCNNCNHRCCINGDSGVLIVKSVENICSCVRMN